MRLYLITHAHTRQDKTVDTALWDLTEAGTTQAAAVARQPFWTEVNRIVLSSEPKTRLTVQPLLNSRPLPVTVDPRFDELWRGGWADNYMAQVQQVFAQPDSPIGEWESAAAAQTRMVEGIADLCERFASQTLVLVGHGLTLSLYRAYLLGQGRVNIIDWQNLSFAAIALADPRNHTLLQDFQPVGPVIPRG